MAAGQFPAIALAGLLLLPAWHLKHPLLFAWRHAETPLLLGLPLLAWFFRRHLLRPARGLFLALFVLTAARELEYRLTRAAVLAAGPAMRTVGAHVIAGYTDPDELRALAGKGLIGGVYLTGRNVRGRQRADVAAELAELQAIRRRAGLPPLIVAADQEGGSVSHLSPMLETMPPLSSLTAARDPAAAACAYGERQGRGLAGLGVTLNFGPVVDLRPREKSAPGGLSNISARAIASDPRRVAEIAGAYLDGLNAAGVRGTLKHFPGLGRVRNDTHLHPARLAASPEELSDDWLPFRQLAGRPGTAIMLGHVTLAALDAEHAVSHSPAIVGGLLRRDWRYDGLLITDDLNMGAVYPLGIGRVAGEALAAGVDLVLVSYDPRQIYRVLAGAARALGERRIAPEVLEESERRLAVFLRRTREPRRFIARPARLGATAATPGCALSAAAETLASPAPIQECPERRFLLQANRPASRMPAPPICQAPAQGTSLAMPLPMIAATIPWGRKPSSEPSRKARLPAWLSASPKLMMALLTGSMRIRATEATVGSAWAMRLKKRRRPKCSTSHARPPQRAARKAMKEPARLLHSDHRRPSQKPKTKPPSA